MRSLKIFGAVAVVVIAAVLTAFMNVKLLNKTTAGDKGFAVVELFTSEGCSSCPPADALVAKIEKESAGKPVYILAYHVDYWDRLGWKDQFSSPDFSKRQREYARFLKSASVYTPQVVVNGKTEFIGSQEGTLSKAIGQNLEHSVGTKLNIDVTGITAKQATLKYTIDNPDKNTVLQVAVIEKSATSKVTAGENNGRIIGHVQIVRTLQKVALTGVTGTTNVVLADGFDIKSWEIIGLLQNKLDGAITGAARAAFSNGTNTSAALKK